jgi:hypothetical protein
MEGARQMAVLKLSCGGKSISATLAFVCACAVSSPVAGAQALRGAAASSVAVDGDSPQAGDAPEYGTARDGTISGIYGGLDLGLMTLDDDAKRRVQAGAGPALHLRLGLAFWDVLLTGIGVGFGKPNDHAPFSEQVVTCQTVNGTVISCDDTPESRESGVTAPFFNVEAGAQHRFRPWVSTSLSLGLVLGQSFGIGTMFRAVECDGCRTVHLDGSATGTYLAPFVRITIGRGGYGAVVLRSAWFLTGDLQQLTMIGGEFGLP